MGALLIVGNLTVDDLEFSDGSQRPLTPGGNSVYAALGAFLFAPQVALGSRVFEDYPSELLARLQERGLHLWLSRPPGLGGVRQSIIYHADGTRSYFPPFPAQRFVELSPSPQELREFLPEVTGLCVAAMPLQVQVPWLQWAAEHGLQAVLDPHHETLDLEQWRPVLQRYDPLFVPSWAEVEMLLGPGLSPQTAADRLQELGLSRLILKLGADGCLVREDDRTEHLASMARQVVDPTGCGDAFAGALTACLAQGAALQQAARAGLVAAAVAIADYGPFALLSASPGQAQKDWRQALSQH